MDISVYFKLNVITCPYQVKFVELVGKLCDPCVLASEVRDGPFDIQGGLGFFLATSYFFVSFCKASFFSKVNCNKFFIFSKNNTLNQKNVNESNTLNEKVLKNLKFLFDH